MRGRDNRWSRGSRDGNRHGGFKRGGPVRGGFRGRGFGNRDGNRFNSSNQKFNRPKYEMPGKRLSEAQIGVTEYMSQHEGFNGIIKSRYSDFQVSEISLLGEVAQLTDTSPPQPGDGDQVEEDEELLLNKYNVEILPLDTWDQIDKVASGAQADAVEIDVTTSSKEERTKIHEAVKKAFGDCIVGSTVTKEDKKYVKFEKYKKGVRVDNRVKWSWPGEFVHFLVHKENCDTMDAANKLADRLRSHIKPSMVGYAGTKDRRAKTTQWFSVRKVDPRRIAAACRDMRELQLGNYSFHPHPLKLGMLQGNKFRIALRNVTADDAVVEAACSRLAENGFINYYGLQRFGTRLEVPTFDIGRKLLKGNFQEAIDSILSEREGPLQQALSLYKSAGAGAAARALPRHAHSQLEARVLRALADRPNDLYYAMQMVPRNTRLLYLHSYQSLVWNRCVSERLRRLGLRPAPGDLVPLQPAQIKEDTDISDSDSEEPDEDKQTEQTDEKINTKSKKESPKERVEVKVLTQADVDSGSYSIFDIVLPLPGHFIHYPPNMKDYYQQLLQEDGLQLELRHKNKSYCLSGAYRAVCVRPRQLTSQCVRYSDPHHDLVLSDLDVMQGRTLDLPEDGKYKALVLSFSLPPSCYATMLLRELLRADTAAHAQARHNDYHAHTTQTGDSQNKDGGDNIEAEGQKEEASTIEEGTNKRKGEEDSGGDEKRVKE